MKKRVIIAFCGSLLLQQSVFANDEANYQKSIDKIANEINAISRNINDNKKVIKAIVNYSE